MKNAHLYWHEASGLDPSNRLVYIVESGDSPIRIARKLIGDGMRWKELVAANPLKKTAPNGNFVTLLVGERLNVPVAWEQLMSKVTPSGGQVVVPAAIVPTPNVTPVIVPVVPAPAPVEPPPGGAAPSVQPSSVVSTISTTPASASPSTGGGFGVWGLAALALGGWYFLGRKGRA